MIKTKIVLVDHAKADVTGITESNAEGARDDVDCIEIVNDNALAKVTHEAAIRSVDKKQLETLMLNGIHKKRQWI